MYVVTDFEHEIILASERTGVHQLEINTRMAENVTTPLVTPVMLSAVKLVSITVPNVFPWARDDIYKHPTSVTGGITSSHIKPFTFATFTQFNAWLGARPGLNLTTSGGSVSINFEAPFTFEGEFWKMYGLEGTQPLGSLAILNPVYKEYDRNISLVLEESDRTNNKAFSLANIHFTK